MTMKRKRNTKAYTKRKRAKTGSKNLRKIIKSVVTKTAETKTAYQSGAAYQIGSGDGLAHNVEYYISQGTSDLTRIGDEIYIKGVKMKIRFVGPTANNALNPGVQTGSPLHVRLSLLKTRTRTTSAISNWFNYAADFLPQKRPSALPQLHQSWDSEKCKVVKSIKRTVTPQAAGLATEGFMEVYVPFKNMKFKYDSDGGGYGTYWNHYFVLEYYMQGQGYTGGSSVPLYFDSEFAIYFKDL